MVFTILYINYEMLDLYKVIYEQFQHPIKEKHTDILNLLNKFEHFWVKH